MKRLVFALAVIGKSLRSVASIEKSENLAVANILMLNEIL